MQEIYYYTNCGNEVKTENITSESMALKVAEKGNKDLAESLVAEGGPLQCGALPEAEASRDDGKKNLLEAVTQSTTSTKKTKKSTNKDKEAEALAPKTIFEWGPHQKQSFVRDSMLNNS